MSIDIILDKAVGFSGGSGTGQGCGVVEVGRWASLTSLPGVQKPVGLSGAWNLGGGGWDSMQ